MPHNSLHPSELFDLEILLPVSPTGYWLHHLNSLRRFGLLDNGQLRARLVLLCGTHKIDPALHDADMWPSIQSVVVINRTNDQVAPNINDYYANVLPEQELQARWYLRVEEDSLTDIRRLVNHLDFTFHWRDSLHMTGSVSSDAHLPYLSTLRELRGERFLQGAGHGAILHEQEHALTSHGAMRRIMSNRMAREFLRRLALIPDGFSDHGLSYAARIAGIPLSQVPFMTAEPRLEEFAAFSASGNGFFHIGGLSTDDAWMWGRYMDKRRSLGLSTDDSEPEATSHSGRIAISDANGAPTQRSAATKPSTTSWGCYSK